MVQYLIMTFSEKIPNKKTFKDLVENLAILGLIVVPLATTILNQVSGQNPLEVPVAAKISGYNPDEARDLSRVPFSPSVTDNRKKDIAGITQTVKTRIEETPPINRELRLALDKMGKFSEFTEYISNLQSETGILIAFPQSDFKGEVDSGEKVQFNNINDQNYDSILRTVKAQVLTVRAFKAIGAKIQTIQFTQAMLGENQNARETKTGEKVNSNRGAQYMDGVLTLNLAGLEKKAQDALYLSVHESTHGLAENNNSRAHSRSIESMSQNGMPAVNNSTIISAMFQTTDDMMKDNPNWINTLDESGLNKMFDRFQKEFFIGQPEEYGYQGTDLISNIGSGIEFNPTSFNKLAANYTQQEWNDQLLQTLPRIAAIPGHKKAGSVGFVKFMQGLKSAPQTFTQEYIENLEKEVQALTTALEYDPKINSGKDERDISKVVKPNMDLAQNSPSLEEQTNRVRQFYQRVDEILISSDNAYVKMEEVKSNLNKALIALGVASESAGVLILSLKNKERLRRLYERKPN
jgi:hypothetical protein